MSTTVLVQTIIFVFAVALLLWLGWIHISSKLKMDIGSVLMNMGLLDEFGLQTAVLRQRAGRSKLGQILVDLGYITEEQLTVALEVQKLMIKGKKGEAMVLMTEFRLKAMAQ